MKIYAVADIHGKNSRLAVIKKNIHHYCPDILVMAGDSCNFLSYHALISFLGKLMIPVGFISGNSDPGHLEKKLQPLPNIRLLDNHPFACNGFEFIGAGGTLPLPFANRISMNEKQVLQKLGKQLTPDTIMVVHPPPRKILDKVAGRFNTGSHNLKRFIDTHQPFMVICGHIHEQAGFTRSGKTWVINCAFSRNASGAIIDISSDRSVRVNILKGADG